jgi:hypothetical protein
MGAKNPLSRLIPPPGRPLRGLRKQFLALQPQQALADKKPFKKLFLSPGTDRLEEAEEFLFISPSP